ncbi:unnamed protein product [Phytomonas sp. Hart1]|nr:unnamed protein product [Phytomonas sp. Hart1]|eukprot:CCW68167.1 unnamed protein product [Phytomonas sp. isolate Hart1]
MKRLGVSRIVCQNNTRFHSTYGITPLTHKQMQVRFGNPNKEIRDQQTLLKLTELQMSKWRLNKWNFRVPLLIDGEQKRQLFLQLDILKSLCIEQMKQNEAVENDIKLVSSLTGISPNLVQQKNRAWLHEEAAKLRWMGELNKAKDLRDAFLRLEVYGSSDHRLLERLCCVYGLGMLGTFEKAFSNLITEKNATGELYVDEGNPFTELLQYIMTRFPHFDIIYDFLGFNPVSGYRASLSRFLTSLFQAKYINEKNMTSGRILFHNPHRKEILFDYGDSKNTIGFNDSIFGLPDFLYIKNMDFYLIIIASNNHWLRNRQVPHRKQLEGIARRGSFVFGIPIDKVRIKNLLLPPYYLDNASLLRLVDIILDLSKEKQKELIPWLSLYDKKLDPKDIDYCELSTTVNEEEWLTL